MVLGIILRDTVFIYVYIYLSIYLSISVYSYQSIYHQSFCINIARPLMITMLEKLIKIYFCLQRNSGWFTFKNCNISFLAS